MTAKKNQKLDEMEALLHRRQADLPAQLQELQIDCAKASAEVINGIQKFTQIRLCLPDMPEFGDRQDEIVGAIGATYMQLLWQVQAWLTREIHTPRSPSATNSNRRSWTAGRTWTSNRQPQKAAPTRRCVSPVLCRRGIEQGKNETIRSTRRRGDGKKDTGGLT